MRNFQSDRFLFLATEEASPTRLAQGHSRRLGFDPTFRYSSTFLRSLRSLSITRVPRYYGRSDSCRPGSSAPIAGSMNTVSVGLQVSLIHVPDLPTPPSPTTPQALDADFSRYPSSHRVPHSRGSRLHLSLAGSPILAGRIEFLNVRMDRSPPAAPHPASRTDAVAVGYRPESVCLKRTSTSPIKHAFRRTRADGPSSAKRSRSMRSIDPTLLSPNLVRLMGIGDSCSILKNWS